MPSLSNPGNAYDDLANTLVADTTLSEQIAEQIEEDTEFVIDDIGSDDMLLGQAPIADGANGWTFTDSVQKFTFTRAFTGLTGASQSVSITGFPANSAILGVALHIDTTWAGEADVAVAIGRTVDPDGYATAFNLNGVATGFAGITTGALRGFDWQANATSGGLALLFTATALADLTQGQVTVHIFFVTPTSPA